MLFTPKRSKFKKYQKNEFPNNIQTLINFKLRAAKSIKLVCLTQGHLKIKQFLDTRLIIKKVIRKKGFLRFNIYPQKSVTKKPLQIRMGKGKGGFSHWCAIFYKGNTFCEIRCKTSVFKRVCLALKKVQKRLPIQTLIKYA
jgi:large subunit ribosomal protein L16